MARAHHVAVIDARTIAPLDAINRSLEEMLCRVSRSFDRIRQGCCGNRELDLGRRKSSREDRWHIDATAKGTRTSEYISSPNE
jgi:hypothetical protein